MRGSKAPHPLSPNLAIMDFMHARFNDASQVLEYFSILIVKHPCSVTNTKCKPNIICHRCRGIAITITYLVVFHAKYITLCKHVITKMQVGTR